MEFVLVDDGHSWLKFAECLDPTDIASVVVGREGPGEGFARPSRVFVEEN